jgi:hypothetical protein
MRWLLVVVALVAVACGGNGDDDADDAGPTATPRAETAASPPARATGTRPPSGAGAPAATGEPRGSPAAASPTAAEPTPTRRPATVASTPRPVATRDTSTRVIAPITPTPTPPDDLVFLVEDGFDSADTTAFFLGTTDYGTTAEIVDGWYTVTVPSGWQVLDAVVTDGLADGVVVADVSLAGNGSAGVVGRSLTEADGTFSFYLCWLDTAGAAGCHAMVRGEWVELLTAGDAAIALLEVNRLSLVIIGETLSFSINDQEIGTLTDAALAAGSWGVYADAYEGATTARFDTVVIAQATGE